MMNKFIIPIFLIFLPFSLMAETETPAEPKKKPEFTENQLNQLKAAEEKYKDNPEMMKLINKVKEQSGLTENAAEQTAVPQSPKPAFQGSADVAEDAYRNQDYETAFKHYQALAAEGDADASMRLGTMYHLGQGTEQDPAAAQAWYKKAADAGDSRAEAFMHYNELRNMTEEDHERTDQIYNEINQQSGAEPGKTVNGETAQQSDRAIKFSVITPDTGSVQTSPSARIINISRAEGTEKLTPEKITGMQHQQPAGSVEPLKPEKFQRNITTN